MAARVESEATPFRAVLLQLRDHLVPDARVKSRGVTKENRRSFAGPLRQRDLNTVDRQTPSARESCF
jgi:hypothetical protein